MNIATALLGETLDRLTDGDLKNYTGSHGRTFIEQLARDLLLDPITAEKLLTARHPAVRAAIDRATALNTPKQALLDRLARCKDRGSVYDDMPKDEANFFRDMPCRLYSLRSWTKEDPSWERMEHAYLPLNQNAAPLGEEVDWHQRRGEYHRCTDQAWFFRCDPREFGMLIDKDPDQPGSRHWKQNEPPRCLYTVRDFPDVNSTKRDPEFLAAYAGRLRRLLAEAVLLGALAP
jgi:hypothetical protein